MIHRRYVTDPTPEQINNAKRIVDEALTAAGIPHALCGGLALQHYGYSRYTDDVDFLVDDRAFNHHGPVVTLKVPITEADGVFIDYVSLPDKPSVARHALETAAGSPQVIPLEALIYMKLYANRQKDRGDVVELLKLGRVDTRSTRSYLTTHAPELVERWDQLLDLASSER
jgi:hypothetical protein